MILGGIALAFLCWAFTFGWSGGNFWIKIGISVLIVSSYSLFRQRPTINVRLQSFLLGALSALALYIIFFVGNALAPYIVPHARDSVGGIYALGTGSNRILVFLLLLLITGPGEEIFWRGFLQKHLMDKWGNVGGYVATTVIYAAVHVFSGNLILTLAAFIAGAFWGALYLWRRDVFLLVVSHSLWSAFIFAVFPIT